MPDSNAKLTAREELSLMSWNFKPTGSDVYVQPRATGRLPFSNLYSTPGRFIKGHPNYERPATFSDISTDWGDAYWLTHSREYRIQWFIFQANMLLRDSIGDIPFDSITSEDINRVRKAYRQDRALSGGRSYGADMILYSLFSFVLMFGLSENPELIHYVYTRERRYAESRSI